MLIQKSLRSRFEFEFENGCDDRTADLSLWIVCLRFAASKPQHSFWWQISQRKMPKRKASSYVEEEDNYLDDLVRDKQNNQPSTSKHTLDSDEEDDSGEDAP